MRRFGARLSKKKKNQSSPSGVSEPGPGVGPLLPGQVDGDAERGRDVFVAQTCEVTQLDNPGREPIFDFEPGQGFVKGEDVIVGQRGRSVGQLHPLERPAVLAPLLAPRRLDQDAPHGLGRGGEEVAAAVPVLDLFDIHQPQVRLMHQGRGLKRLPRFLLGELLRRQFAQLVVDERQELLGGLRVALFDCRQNAGHITHELHHVGRCLAIVAL